jgi:hypothetical protein
VPDCIRSIGSNCSISAISTADFGSPRCISSVENQTTTATNDEVSCLSLADVEKNEVRLKGSTCMTSNRDDMNQGLNNEPSRLPVADDAANAESMVVAECQDSLLPVCDGLLAGGPTTYTFGDVDKEMDLNMPFESLYDMLFKEPLIKSRDYVDATANMRPSSEAPGLDVEMSGTGTVLPSDQGGMAILGSSEETLYAERANRVVGHVQANTNAAKVDEEEPVPVKMPTELRITAAPFGIDAVVPPGGRATSANEPHAAVDVEHSQLSEGVGRTELFSESMRDCMNTLLHATGISTVEHLTPTTAAMLPNVAVPSSSLAKMEKSDAVLLLPSDESVTSNVGSLEDFADPLHLLNSEPPAASVPASTEAIVAAADGGGRETEREDCTLESLRAYCREQVAYLRARLADAEKSMQQLALLQLAGHSERTMTVEGNDSQSLVPHLTGGSVDLMSGTDSGITLLRSTSRQSHNSAIESTNIHLAAPTTIGYAMDVSRTSRVECACDINDQTSTASQCFHRNAVSPTANARSTHPRVADISSEVGQDSIGLPIAQHSMDLPMFKDQVMERRQKATQSRSQSDTNYAESIIFASPIPRTETLPVFHDVEAGIVTEVVTPMLLLPLPSTQNTTGQQEPPTQVAGGATTSTTLSEETSRLPLCISFLCIVVLLVLLFLFIPLRLALSLAFAIAFFMLCFCCTACPLSSDIGPRIVPRRH